MVLGIHGAADRLDDVFSNLLVRLQTSWFEHELLLRAGTWLALAVELAVVGWALVTRLRANGPPIRNRKDWLARGSLQAGIAALSWLPLAMAGCWVVAIAVEDSLAGFIGDFAIYVGAICAVLVAWRLGLTGWVRVVRRAPVARHWLAGWPWLLPVTLVSALALRHGLPIWGWL